LTTKQNGNTDCHNLCGPAHIFVFKRNHKTMVFSAPTQLIQLYPRTCCCSWQPTGSQSNSPAKPDANRWPVVASLTPTGVRGGKADMHLVDTTGNTQVGSEVPAPNLPAYCFCFGCIPVCLLTIPVWPFRQEKWRYAFCRSLEVPVWHTVSYRPTSSTG